MFKVYKRENLKLDVSFDSCRDAEVTDFVPQRVLKSHNKLVISLIIYYNE